MGLGLSPLEEAGLEGNLHIEVVSVDCAGGGSGRYCNVLYILGLT